MIKPIPYDLEAEVSLLGSLLCYPENLLKVIESINANDFYDDRHKKIFNIIVDMYLDSKPIEINSIIIEVGKGNLNEIGGVSYLTELFGSGSISENLQYYSKIIADKSSRRKLIRKLKEIIEKTYNDEENVDFLINDLEKGLLTTKTEEGILTNNQLLNLTMNQIENTYKTGGDTLGFRTGINLLDIAINGLHTEEFTVLAARPSMGKTMVALQICEGLTDNGSKIALFSMEMSAELLGNRRLAAQSLIDCNKIRSGKLNDGEWEKLGIAYNKLSKKNNYYTDCSFDNSIHDIFAKAKMIKQRDGLDVIIIDHMALLKTKSVNSRHLEVGEITRMCKLMAKNLKIHVLLLCQLNRANEARIEKRPFLSDIAESGRIEQDADTVIFVHREYYYSKDIIEKDDIELILAKNRNGKDGVLNLKYKAEYQKIF